MDGIMEKKGETAEVVVPGFTDYRKYKEELDGELTRAAQSFIRIGFLLRVAEDTDILKGSGYRNVTEFAAAEYGLDKTQVSRFININIRFSENGYSDYLQERYEKFGYAKLAVMLSLPDAVTGELPDSLSKSEVQMVAEEVKAEAAVSDIEFAIERAEVAPVQPDGKEATILYQAAAQLCKEQQDLFQKLWMEQEALENMQEILVPLGEAVFMVRPPGTGRLMITVRDQETSITVVRTGEKEKYSTEEFVAKIWGICIKGMTPEDAFRTEFGEEMEKTAASSGQASRTAAAVEKKEPKQRRVSRVTKARTPKPEPAAATEEQPEAAVKGTEGTGQEEQLPGQMEVFDYPELIPEERKEEDHGAEEKGAEGGESPAADARMGSGTGEPGERDPGIQESHEIPGTAEDDGCAEDPGGVRDQEEEKTWRDVVYELEAVKRNVMLCNHDYPALRIPQLRELYQATINLAAAVEEVLIRSEKNE